MEEKMIKIELTMLEYIHLRSLLNWKLSRLQGRSSQGDEDAGSNYLVIERIKIKLEDGVNKMTFGE